MDKQAEKFSQMTFAKVYPLYQQKLERKGRTKAELDQIIHWLTGYDQTGLEQALAEQVSFETFFDQAPALNPKRDTIKGVICGVRVEDIQDPLVQLVRYLDKLVDQAAKGKTLEKLLL